MYIYIYRNADRYICVYCTCILCNTAWWSLVFPWMIQNHRVPIKICIRRADFTDMGRLYTTRPVMIRCIEAAYDEFYNWNIGTTSGCAPREPIASLPLADLIGISLWMMTTELHLCRWIQNACRVVDFFREDWNTEPPCCLSVYQSSLA